MRPSIVERNVERLLGRAYVPVQPSDLLVREVRQAFLQRFDELYVNPQTTIETKGIDGSPIELPIHPSERERTRLRSRSFIAAAAVLLALFGAWRFVGTNGLADSGTHDASALQRILAGGDVALRHRTLEDLDAERLPDWGSVSARDVARGLRFERGWIDVATPVDIDLELELATRVTIPVSARLSAESRAQLEGDSSGWDFELLEGAIDVDAMVSEETLVRTSEGDVTLLHARAAFTRHAFVGRSGALAARALPGDLGDLAIQQGQAVRIELWTGALSLAPLAEPKTNWRATDSGPVVLWLVDGRLSREQNRSDRTEDALARPLSLEEDVEDAIERSQVPDETASPRATVVLRGRVIDDETERPIPSFVVSLIEIVGLPDVAEPERHRFESVDGTFALRLDSATRAHVFVEAEGYAVFSERRFQLDSEHELDVRLSRGVRMTGVVTDAETGEPLEGALVVSETDMSTQILPFHDLTELDVPQMAATRTSKDGTFELRGLSPRLHTLRASHPERSAAWKIEVDLGNVEALSEQDFELRDEARITGVAEDEHGHPVRNVVVVASHFDFTGQRPCMSFTQATTDREGRYELGGLPAGQCALLLFERGPEQPPSRFLFASPRVGETLTIDFKDRPSSAYLAGKLSDETGRAYPGYALSIQHVEDGREQMRSSTTADTSGEFAFPDLEPGVYRVFAGPSMGPSNAFVGEVELFAGALRHDFVLASGSIAALIRDAESNQPLAGVVAIAERLGADGPDYVSRAISGPDGHLSLAGLSHGTYSVHFIDTLAGHALRVFERVVVGDAAIEPLDVALQDGGSVTLSVRDPSGDPVAGAFVELMDSTLERARRYSLEPTRTSQAGRHTTHGLSAGPWRVRVSREGFQSAQENVVIAARERTELTITLTVE